MVLNVRRGLGAFLVLASVRLAAFGCAGPEAFQSNLEETGAAGTSTGMAGQVAGGGGGDTNPSGLGGTAGLEDAGTSGVAGATGGSGGSVAGQGGNIGP